MTGTALPMSTHIWVIQNYVDGPVKLTQSSGPSPSDTFALKTQGLPSAESLPKSSLLVQTLFLSNDPAQRFWVGKQNIDADPDMASLPLGSAMNSSAISKVLAVGGDNEDKFRVGDLVESMSAWAEYAVVDKATAQVRQALPGISPTAWLGALGMSGITAYWGLTDICKVKETDTLVVSGAAGAIGNVVVQYAKKVLNVKRVVAIAGSDEKCKWLKTVGADEAVNYKSSAFVEDLEKATPDLVDAFYDNVGGTILDTVVARMKTHGIVAVCGIISAYNNPEGMRGLSNYGQILFKRLTVRGFTVLDYGDRFEEARARLVEAATTGKLIVDGAETVVDGVGKFEDIPKIWNSLFEGANTGKLITKLA